MIWTYLEEKKNKQKNDRENQVTSETTQLMSKNVAESEIRPKIHKKTNTVCLLACKEAVLKDAILL